MCCAKITFITFSDKLTLFFKKKYQRLCGYTVCSRNLVPFEKKSSIKIGQDSLDTPRRIEIKVSIERHIKLETYDSYWVSQNSSHKQTLQ